MIKIQFGTPDLALGPTQERVRKVKSVFLSAYKKCKKVLCSVTWERIIVHICRRFGNLKKTYLGAKHRHYGYADV